MDEPPKWYRWRRLARDGGYTRGTVGRCPIAGFLARACISQFPRGRISVVCTRKQLVLPFQKPRERACGDELVIVALGVECWRV